MPRDRMPDDSVKASGVLWITLAHEGGHSTVTVDVAALRTLVSTDDVHPDDEHILEVVGRAKPIRLWSAVPLECFLFKPSMVLAAQEMTRRLPGPSSASVPSEGSLTLLVAQLQTPAGGRRLGRGASFVGRWCGQRSSESRHWFFNGDVRRKMRLRGERREVCVVR